MPKRGMEPIRRKQLILAVLKCVADEGIDQVTLDKTAASAQVSKGVVTYYFKNKKSLLIESFREFLIFYFEKTESKLTADPIEIQAGEILLIIAKVSLGLISGEDDLTQEDCKKILMQLYSRMTVSPEYRKMMKEVYEVYLDAIVETLRLGNSTGEFHIERIETTAVQLMALLDGLIIYSVMGFQGSEEDLFRPYKVFVENL